MEMASWTQKNFDGYPKSMKWSCHYSICWKVCHIIDIEWVCGMLGCPPGAVGARKFARLWRPVPPCGNGFGRITTDWMPL
mgnify:CR=1 FL=1